MPNPLVETAPFCVVPVRSHGLGAVPGTSAAAAAAAAAVAGDAGLSQGAGPAAAGDDVLADVSPAARALSQGLGGGVEAASEVRRGA